MKDEKFDVQHTLSICMYFVSISISIDILAKANTTLKTIYNIHPYQRVKGAPNSKQSV